MQETISTVPTFFLPILILVIIQLAKVAREAELVEMIDEDHSPLLISPVISMPFSLLKGLIKGVTTVIIVKLHLDSIKAKAQSQFYELSEPVIKPYQDVNRKLLERIIGEEIDDESEKVQLILK